MGSCGAVWQSPRPGADLYLLNSALDDWPDAETDAILRNVAAAMHERTRLAVMGGVAPDDAPRLWRCWAAGPTRSRRSASARGAPAWT
jgi:hypothetical protein